MKKLLNNYAILISALVALTACQPKPPTPEPRQAISVTLGDETILHLTGAKMPCQFTKPMQCLVVADQSGKHFGIAYDSIDDFRPETGKSYTLKVRPKINSYVLDDNNHMIMGYKLIEILNQR